MSQLYVVCEFGLEAGRILIGSVHGGRLQISETRHFPNTPVQEGNSVHWNIPEVYEELLQGLRCVGDYEEPVRGISCVSWPGAYLLFDAEGALIMPTYHHHDPRSEIGINKVRSSPEIDQLFDETGMHPVEGSMLFQLASETPKRMRQAGQILPIADGFNFLLSGVARIDASMASASQLYNPATRQWSEQLLRLVGINARQFPEVVPCGTVLGPLRDEISQSAKLEKPNVLTACSDQMAAMLMGLPLKQQEKWAFLQPGKMTVMGAQTTEPVLTDEAHDLSFSSQLAYGGCVNLYKRTNGLGILDACAQYWETQNRAMDLELLSHLAGSAPPFESLIDPNDPRFITPNDMPLKIQAYCKETNQPEPRKPGPIYRCILESLALMYRKMLSETQQLTGREVDRVHVLNGKSHSLLNHFIANALQKPIVIVSPDSAAIGNILVQALTIGDLKTADEARDLVLRSLKPEVIAPHASIWDMAYDRFISLAPTAVAAE